MITVVSGIHRSGTSAMMQALIAGGQKPIWSKVREKQMGYWNQKEFPANPEGFYEVGQSEYMRLGFTTELPDECCIKIQAIGLPILAAGKGYKIIYMRRDPEIIKRSYIKVFGEEAFDKETQGCWPTYYWSLLDGVRSIMQNRRDVDLIEIQYNDMIEKPLFVMEKIKAFGVNLNPSRAARAIRPELRRCDSL